MKKIFLILFIYLLLFKTNPVFAVEKISGSAAILSSSILEDDPRLAILIDYLDYRNKDLTKYSINFIQEADKANIDWKLVVAIAGLESSYCKFLPQNSYNCWGWGIPTGAQSGIGFKNYVDGIKTVSEGLRNNYINRGLITIDQIGSVYAASPTWSFRIKYIMSEIENWEPVAIAKTAELTL